MNHSMAAKILHHLLKLDNVRTMAMMKPKVLLVTPIVLTKNTRGLLPLQIDHRMKFGCD